MPHIPKMDLAHTDNARRWDTMIQKAEAQLARDPGFFTEYDLQFVKDMIRKNYEDRPIWNPSIKQWNHLHGLVS